MKRELYIVLLLVWTLGACQKEFLDAKSSQNQKVPATLSDYQAIFDNSTGSANPMNGRSSHLLGIIGSDEFYLSDVHFNNLIQEGALAYGRFGYIWDREVYMPVNGVNFEPYDFTTAYNRILRCNIVLGGIEKIPKTEANELEWNNVKGSAHFYRALDYYNLCQLYTQPLGRATAENLGMPLRIDPDPTIKINRATLQETYDLIVSDLQIAETLLPVDGENVFRPSQLAIQALWARLFLQQEGYEGALQSANWILEKKNELLDYNEVQLTANYTFPIYGVENKEVFFSTAAYNAPVLSNNILQVDSVLYEYYEEEDLRKLLFFKNSADGRINFWGSYYGNNMFFTGFALDEIYLIRAEALARLGELTQACETLNTLLRTRFQNGSYEDFVSEDSREVLDKILLERRKQLIFRGVRWEDLRRLNLHPETAKTLIRLIGDEKYELLPNSKRYVWPFPPEAILVGGFEQNER